LKSFLKKELANRRPRCGTIATLAREHLLLQEEWRAFAFPFLGMSHNLHVPKWAETSPMPVEGNSRALAAFRSVGILFAFERIRPARILFSQRR